MQPPLELHERIGAGSSSLVYRGTTPQGERVAVKVLDLEALGDGVENVVAEVSLLAQARCPQLCEYRGAYIVGAGAARHCNCTILSFLT